MPNEDSFVFLDVDENDPSVVSYMATIDDWSLPYVTRLVAFRNLAVPLGKMALADYGGRRLPRSALRGSELAALLRG